MKKSKLIDVVVAGHLCLDLSPRIINSPGQMIEEIFRPGSLVSSGDIIFSTGGTVANTGMALKIFGNRVEFVAKVGNDFIGSIIIELLKKKGGSEGISVSEKESSSYTVVLAPVGIDRIFLHNAGTNDNFSSKDIDYELVEKALLFHLGYPTLMRSMFVDEGIELSRVFSKVKAGGTLTSMDISLPDPASEAGKADWYKIYKKTLPYVDIYLPSIEEAFFTLHPEEYLALKDKHKGKGLLDYIEPNKYSSMADEFLRLGCKMIALKAGKYGWYFKTSSELSGLGLKSHPESWENRELWCPAFYIEKIVSATGAGDASIAAFLTGIIKELSIVECLKAANCAGTINLTQMDSLSGLVPWGELMEKMKTMEMEENPFLQGTEWKWDKRNKLWEKF